MHLRTPLLFAVTATALAAAAAHAQPLQIVTVGAPAINCVFDTSCTVPVTDHSAPLFGSGFLQSRTYEGQPGAPAAGQWAYVYRIDLRNAAPATARVTALRIEFGPVPSTLDYDGNGSAGEHVFVVTTGGLGTVGPAAATRTGNTVTFRFNPAVEAGQTSYFFGLASPGAPRVVSAQVTGVPGGNITVEARAPGPPARGVRPERPGRAMPVPGRGRPGLGTPAPIASEDCLSYDPRNVRIVDEGADGWLLTDGVSRMLMLNDQADAERALALARRHTAHCFIGRGNPRPNRSEYVRDYWMGTSGISTVIDGEDCVAYNPATVNVFDRGDIGWRMEDGSHWLLLYHDQADANRGLLVAKANTGRLCFIGRGNSRPDRAAYITEYWR
jgi:hypothetical protein